MKKALFFLFVIITVAFSSEAEKMFWDEVKDTNDIELLKLYKKRYPNGIFESLADIKIKRLKQVNVKSNNKATVPDWLKGYTADYKFYGVGKANRHFKGEEYQRALAIKRAKRELEEKFENYNLSEEQINEYTQYISTKEYKDKRERIYILLYIDNENL